MIWRILGGNYNDIFKNIYNIIILGTLFVYFSIKLYIIYKKFIDYLFKIGDTKTIEMVRKLNPFGQREFKSISIIFNLPDVLLEKYERTNDNNYLLYFTKYKQIEKFIIILGLFLFLLFIFYMIRFY